MNPTLRHLYSCLFGGALFLLSPAASIAQESTELGRARETYAARIAKLQAAEQAALEKLKDRYAAGLGALEKQFTAKGALSEVVALRSERDRFEAARLVPAEKVVGTPEELRRHQLAYLGAAAKLEKDTRVGVAKVSKAYVAYLDRLKVELTKKSRIEEALLAENEAKTIRATVNLELGAPAPAPRTRPHQQIPADATAWRGHRYRIYRERITWHEAKKRCEGMGGYLCIINNSAENRFLDELGAGKGVFSLGATDEAREGAWRWVDGSRMSYKNWNDGQPNDQNGEDHLTTHPAHWPKWNDFPGDSSKIEGFICEWN